MDALCEANGTFTLRLLKALCEHRPSENVIFSPVSLSSVLAMVLLGAKGDTAAQMAQVSQERGLFPVSCPLARCILPSPGLPVGGCGGRGADACCLGRGWGCPDTGAGAEVSFTKVFLG